MTQEATNSPDRERLFGIGFTHEGDDPISDVLDSAAATGVSELTQGIKAGAQLTVDGDGITLDDIVGKIDSAACVIERNVLETAFPEAVSIQPDPAVSERLANMIHSNVLCGLDTTSPESSQESNQ